MSTPTDSYAALTPVSDYTLERIALGELVGDELVAAHNRLAVETGGFERLRAIEHSNVAILKAYPAEVMVPRIQNGIRAAEALEDQGAFRRGWWAGLSMGLVAAAAAVLFMALLPRDEVARVGPVDVTPEVTRLKGLEPHLVVHRRATDGSERLHPGETVVEGDVLQLGYVSGGETYGAIVSIDGAGVVTLHHPKTATEEAQLGGDGRVDLPYSYELDDAPDFERFVFVTSDESFDVHEVLLSAKRLAGTDSARDRDLALDERLHQHSLVLKKGALP